MSNLPASFLRFGAKNRVPSQGVPNKQLSRLVPFPLIGRVVACSDIALIIVASLLTGIGYHLVSTGSYGHIETFLAVGALTAVNFSAILTARGVYNPHNVVNFRQQLRETSTVWLCVFFLLSVVAFSLKISETYSRGAILSFFWTAWVLITIWRLLVSRVIAKGLAVGGFAEQKIILLAEDALLNGSSIVEKLKRYGYKPARTYEISQDVFSSADGQAQLLNAIEEITDLSRNETIECVFLLMSWENRRAVDQLMNYLRVLSVPVHLLPDSNVAHFLKNRIVNVGAAWTAELKRAPLTSGERICKRVFDVLIASSGLIMLAPTLGLIALLIKLESRGPALFMQTRNGFNGRPFRICKFRTMSVLEDGHVIRQATKNDPRITRFGRLLRRANIDELPQLLNVILGDMSLVGPRPHAAAHNSEYEKIIANYAYRYHVKPGVTGWAQVNGFRGETRRLDLMAKRVELDLWYINNWSFWLDCKVLLRTLFIGLQANAY